MIYTLRQVPVFEKTPPDEVPHRYDLSGRKNGGNYLDKFEYSQSLNKYFGGTFSGPRPQLGP